VAAVSAPLRVALLGCGTVGSEVVRLLHDNTDDLAARIGAPLELAGIAVRRLGRPRDLPVDPSLFTTDAATLVARDDVDLVVEVIGGIEPARTLILSALRRGRGVVTANKALLAEDGATLYDAADRGGADLYYEASVAGAIPLLRPLRESLAGDNVSRVIGIVNGTTNYVLTRRRWATPRPTRPRTSRGSTPRPRPRSWPASPSTPGSPLPTCTARASAR